MVLLDHTEYIKFDNKGNHYIHFTPVILKSIEKLFGIPDRPGIHQTYGQYVTKLASWV